MGGEVQPHIVSYSVQAMVDDGSPGPVTTRQEVSSSCMDHESVQQESDTESFGSLVDHDRRMGTSPAPGREVPQQRIARVWGNWGEYTLDPQWRQWALEQLGVGDVPIRVDLFSEPWSSAAEMFITRQMDAFTYDWGALQKDTQMLLWANPPFKMMGKVAQKLLEEPCRIAICTPEWDTEAWWSMLQSMPHRRVRFPQRVKLFFGGYKKTALPQVKAWRTVVWLIDNRAHASSVGNRGKGLEQLKQELSKMDQVLWSHGYRGGKPMMPNRALPLRVDKAIETDNSTVASSTQTELPGEKWVGHPQEPARLQTRNSSEGPEKEPEVQTVRTLESTPALLCEAGVKPQNKQVTDQEQQTDRECQETPELQIVHLRGGMKIYTNERRNRPPTGGLEPHLRMAVKLRLDEEDEGQQAMALIDTGAEVCLIRRGLLQERAFREAEFPLKLVAANNDPVVGGTKEVDLHIHFYGVEEGTKVKQRLRMPTTLYEAAIDEDIILSYRWLAERDIKLSPREHGFKITVDRMPIWVEGLRSSRQRANARLPSKPVFVGCIPLQDTVHVAPQSESEPEETIQLEEATLHNEGGEVEQDRIKPRALDMFCGRKSAAKVLEEWGYEVVTLDNDPKRNPTICTDVLEWNYRGQFPKGYFQLIVACPPCTEYSQAMTMRAPQMEMADEVVRKTLEIIRYFQPEKWWLETPRNGRLPRRKVVDNLPYVDVDYCYFEDCGYQKPTRFYGSDHVLQLDSVFCDKHACPGLVRDRPWKPGRSYRHRWHKGGGTGHVHRETAYHIPRGVIEYVSGLAPQPPPWPPVDPDDIVTPEMKLLRITMGDPEFVKALEEVQSWRQKKVRFLLPEDDDNSENEEDDDALVACLGEEEEWEVARRLMHSQRRSRIRGVKMGPQTTDEVSSTLAETLRNKLIDEFKDSSLSGVYPKEHPVRGPNGEAEIWLKPGARPVSIAPYPMKGERREALSKLVEDCIREGKMEPGKSAWNLPVFPVPKKKPGEFRIVQDLRALNDATVKDGHPLPRIGDMIQRQAKNKIWCALDLKDGFHQMPMKKEHRHFTCMSTPHGVMQWTVLVMGLKNAAAQFQRMMEWSLQEQPGADAYIDDVIIGGSDETEEKSLQQCYERTRAVLQRSAELNLVYKGDKCKLFQRRVEFCGHILSEGKRSPAPGKLAPIQLWELPETVTALRGFLGLTNYFSEYVHHYAEVAAPLMAKLRLNRQDGKKGSKLKLHWTPEEKSAFEKLKARLAEQLELRQVDPDRPFRLHTDASDFAVGAELLQEFEGKWQTVGLYSRKLAAAQLNWTTREKETYAIVAALQKWANTIGFQPVEVHTDHKSLGHWLTEHVNTPSGPRGRRARWHEALSLFCLTVVYVPGPDNVVADSMSRFAYPATSAREDVSFHGSAAASAEVAKMLEEERRVAEQVGQEAQKKTFVDAEENLNLAAVRSFQEARLFPVTLRSGRQTDREEDAHGEGSSATGGGADRPRRMHSPPPPLEPQGGRPVEEDVAESTNGSPLLFKWAVRGQESKERSKETAKKTPSTAVQENVEELAENVEELAEEGMPMWGEDDEGDDVLEGGDDEVFDSLDDGVIEHDTPSELDDGDEGEDELAMEEGADYPKFAFQPLGPTAGGPVDMSRAFRRKRRTHFRNEPVRSVPVWDEECAQYISENWTPEYEGCPEFSSIWEEINSSPKVWPKGYSLHRDKLMHRGRLCVPWGRVSGMILGHHIWNAHQGVARLLPDLELNYEFPDDIDVAATATKLVKECLVCQACTPPNWKLNGPMHFTPIPPRVMAHVCLDVFSMPKVEWQNKTYDGFLVCVDRHSGWMIAKPTDNAERLTGQAAANLLLDSGWGEMAIPSTITCDQGAQFISHWWETMCSRLGIREAYSQAHHHRANGRAEVAGRVILTMLRKLHAQSKVNWVEALPRALRIHHDTVDPVIGMSPYMALFGRPRNLACLPWTPGKSEGAHEFFDRIEEIDAKVAEAREKHHSKIEESFNKRTRARPPYKVGDHVYYLKPRAVGGTKIAPWWFGPYRVIDRLGENSYRLKVPNQKPLDAHATQLRPCHWSPEPWGPIRFRMKIPPTGHPDQPPTVEEEEE